MSKRRVIPAGEFKARCLKLMDEIGEEGGELIITKRGKPIAKLVPVDRPAEQESVFGSMRGSVTFHGDIIGPFHEDWEVDRD